MSKIIPSKAEEFGTKHVGNVIVLEIIADLDEGGAIILQFTLEKCRRENHHKIVINMDDAQYISYDGVGVLADYWHILQKLDGDIRLANANLYVKEVFKMCGGPARMPECFSSEETAIASFG